MSDDMLPCDKQPNWPAIDMAIEVLNRALEADPVAINELFNHRSLANQALVADPTIQCVAPPEGPPFVRLLGLINGLFGCDEYGWGYIAATYSDDSDYAVLKKFGRTSSARAVAKIVSGEK